MLNTERKEGFVLRRIAKVENFARPVTYWVGGDTHSEDDWTESLVGARNTSNFSRHHRLDLLKPGFTYEVVPVIIIKRHSVMLADQGSTTEHHTGRC